MKISLLLFILVLAIGGYFGYQYIKEKPPDAVIDLLTATPPPPPLPSGPEAPFAVPPEFRATIYARDVAGARVLARDDLGTLLLSQTREGKVVALPDTDANGQSDETRVILEGLNEPHGILVHCGAESDGCRLFVAETDGLTSYQYDSASLSATEPERLLELPSGEGHFTRTLLMHPDGKRLLVSVGSSCNVCIEDDERRASVLSYDLETRSVSPYATGLRNTVFMAVHPNSGEVWGTDNGRDLIGDDIPPDEINILSEGKNYGWPFCYGKNILDTDFSGTGQDSSCDGREPSHIDLQAHSAALGLSFVSGSGWPEAFQDDLFVAFHGSWNRSEPTGYKVVRIPLGQDGSVEGEPADFMTGFLSEDADDEDDALGRPVDVHIEADGTMYVSDDKAGAVYIVAERQ